MKIFRILAVIIVSTLINGCVTTQQPLLAPSITINDSIQGYKYVFITPTTSMTSTSGGVYGGTYGVYGSTQSKSFNPSDVITGILLKEGYIRLLELDPKLADETLIVNFGESGRRSRGWGYTIEVTIQFVSAASLTKICSCTAEGQGQTEADDIRIAINRCLSSLFSNNADEKVLNETIN